MTVVTAGVVSESGPLYNLRAALVRLANWQGPVAASACCGSKRWQQARSGNVQRDKDADVGRVCGAGRYVTATRWCWQCATEGLAMRASDDAVEGCFRVSGSELRGLGSSRGERSALLASRRQPNNRAGYSVMHRPQCARERIDGPNLPDGEARERKGQGATRNECGGSGRSKRKDAARWEQERGSRAVWFSRAHIKSQPWWRAILEAAQWVAGPLSALTTPACAGCFRRSISADVEPRQEVIVAQFTTLSLFVSVVRGCADNLSSGSRCAVASAALIQTRHLWSSPRALSNCFAAPHWIGNIKPHQAPFLQILHTVTLNRPPRVEIISESQKGHPNLRPHSRACQ